MILPGSQLLNVILLAAGMLCWGFWANTFRMTSKWRFELYYFDFALGVLLAALAIGLTFGSLGWDGFALTDDLRIAGKREDVFAALAGVAFNLGNMFILGALSVAGVTAAYIIGLGLMLTAGLAIGYLKSPSGSGSFLFMGAVLVVASAALLAIASRSQSLARLAALAREGRTKSTKKTVSLKGLFLAALGGIVAGVCFPLIDVARQGDDGLGPYALGLFFALGLFVSTPVFNLFFMNLPIQGEPLEVTAYFGGKFRAHWLGILGGVLCYAGLAAFLIMARAEGINSVPPAALRAIAFAAPVVGALTGLLRWKEFAGAEDKVRALLGVSAILFVAGAAGLSLAANFS
jgi:glucose uptake protein